MADPVDRNGGPALRVKRFLHEEWRTVSCKHLARLIRQTAPERLASVV